MAARSSATSGAGLGGVASAPMPLQPATASNGRLAAAAASTARRDRSAVGPAAAGPPAAVPAAAVPAATVPAVTDPSRQRAAGLSQRHPSMSLPPAVLARQAAPDQPRRDAPGA